MANLVVLVYESSTRSCESKHNNLLDSSSKPLKLKFRLSSILSPFRQPRLLAVGLDRNHPPVGRLSTRLLGRSGSVADAEPIGERFGRGLLETIKLASQPVGCEFGGDQPVHRRGVQR
jgi:hypothetical protein